MSESDWLLAASGIGKRFGAVQALTDVDFEVRAGEVVGLVGDNGAGKSTLIKCFAGVHTQDDGEIRFDGHPVRVPTPSAATALGIATVYQDLALADNLDVVANLFLGQEMLEAPPWRAARWIDEITMEHRSTELLESLSIMVPDVRTPVASLSGGQRQTVAIARSLIGAPKLVILDEPTAALGVAQTAQVLELIGRLRARGLGVIVISHNLANVFAVTDRIIVLRLGQRAATFDTATTSEEAVVAAITGVHDAIDALRPEPEEQA